MTDRRCRRRRRDKPSLRGSDVEATRTRMGTTGVVVRRTKSRWTRASAAAAAALVVAVVASLVGVGRSSGDGSTKMRVFADDWIAKGTTSLPTGRAAASRSSAADEGYTLTGASMLNRRRPGVIRRKRTPPTVFCRSPRILNPLDSKGNYSATSNKTKLVHCRPLMGGLLYLVQRGGAALVPSSLYQM